MDVSSTARLSGSAETTDLPSVQVLVVEDDRRVAALLAATLTQQGYQVIIAPSGAIALQQARTARPDLVLIDLLLGGDLDSITTAARLHHLLGCPILYVTAQSSNPPSGAALPWGRLSKSLDLSDLDDRIERVLQHCGQRLSGSSQCPSALPPQTSRLDAGLPPLLEWPTFQSEFFQQVSRLAYPEASPRSLGPRPKPLRANGLLPLVSVRIDRLHRIYRRWGQQVGDQLLQQIARRLMQTTPALAVALPPVSAPALPQDLVLLWQPVKTRGQVLSVAQAALGAIAQPIEIGAHSHQVTASVGVVFYPRDARRFADLWQQSAQIVSRLQQQGGNRYELYTAAPAASAAAELLQQAATPQDLHLYYQPQFDLRSGAIVGLAASVRWCHPDQGLLPLAAVLPTDADWSAELSHWLLRTACQQLQAWQLLGLSLPLTLPVRAVQLQQADFAHHLAHLLQVHQLPAAALTLEFEEAWLTQYPDLVRQHLRSLGQLGVGLMLGLGGGRPAIEPLQPFAGQRLKLNPAHIRGLHCHLDRAAWVGQVIAAAHYHHLCVVAAGVATAGELAQLQQQQCDWGQGDWLTVPLRADQLLAWLSERKPFPLAQ